jgi:F0F1-type ATP synthase assembly protein I
MLEIILLIYLTRHVGETVQAKGRRSGWFKLMTVLLWIGGEITGMVIGVIVSRLSDTGNALIYVFALVGAAMGAGISVLIARSVSPLAFDQPPAPPTFR